MYTMILSWYVWNMFGFSVACLYRFSSLRRWIVFAALVCAEPVHTHWDSTTKEGMGDRLQKTQGIKAEIESVQGCLVIGNEFKGSLHSYFSFFSPSPFTTCIECNVYSGFNCNCLIEICHNLLCYICSSTYFYLQPSDLFSVDNVRTSRWFLNSAKKGIYPVPQPQALPWFPWQH